MAEKVYRTHCSRMDHGGCGLLVTVKDGRVIRVRGDPDSPISLGYICPKGLATVERLYHPDRLLYPLLRKGRRGEGRWHRIAWSEALDIVRSKISDARSHFGARSIMFGQGAPKGLEFFLLLRLANVLGSPNVAGPQNVCHMPREIASSLTCGFWPDVDYDHPPDCIVLWGSNLDKTNEEGAIHSRLQRALDRGACLIVVDPRPTKLAKRAELWLRLRPGTDAALALGMMQVIIEEGLLDKGFVERWTVGFSELRSRVEQYPLDIVEKITWVPRETIREAARLYAIKRPAAIQWGNALEHTVLSHHSCRAVLCLMAITGNLEIPGGNIRSGVPPSMSLREFVLPGQIENRHAQMISAPWNIHPAMATVPIQLATQALLDDEPYPIKFLYLQGTNPLISYPDTLRVKNALERVPFMTVTDLFLTPTAAMADLVLPAATHFEFDDIGHYGLPHGFLLARSKLIEPPEEAWSDLKILNELGKILGLQNYFWGNEHEMLDQVLAPSGLNYRAFQEQGILWAERPYLSHREKGFKTPSKKVELYCRALEDLGLDPVPSYENPLTAIGGLSKAYPFILTSAKDPVFFHSANRQLDSLRKISREPFLEISTETAKNLGIQEGDRVRIRTEQGSIRQRAHLTPDLDPRVICAAYGWWFPEWGYEDSFGSAEANLNVLTDSRPPYNPLVASVNLRGIPCAVEKDESMS